MFLAYLNNAESGVEYISRLQSTIEGDLVALTVSSAVSDKQTAKMSSCLSGLAAVSNKLKTVLDSGMAALRLVVRTRGLTTLSTNWVTVGRQQLSPA